MYEKIQKRVKTSQKLQILFKKLAKTRVFVTTVVKTSKRKKAESLCLFRSQNAKNVRHTVGGG